MYIGNVSIKGHFDICTSRHHPDFDVITFFELLAGNTEGGAE
jgi:hypothetical protein